MRIDSAHMALLSDCFSKATVSTRLCTPPLTRPAATRAVEPPTLPAVCTRIMGLPVAPRASARYSSGITTPSNMSGALPITTASTSFQPTLASSRARMAASRHRPAMETSARLASCLVWPTPVMATLSATTSLLPGRRPGSAAGPGRTLRGRRVGEVSHAERMRLDAMVDAADPRRPVGDLAGPVPGGEDHGRRTVGDRRAVVLAQRRQVLGFLQKRVDVDVARELGVGVVLG